MTPRTQGFTLIELLVAVTILALVSAMAYRGLNTVIATQRQLASASRTWRDLALFLDRLQDDVSHPAHREMRDRNGALQASWQANTGELAPDQANLVLSRIGAEGLGVQRIGYRFAQGTVEEFIWPQVDLAPQSTPAVYALIHGIKRFQLQYLTNDQHWVNTWPLPGQVGGAPRAVALSMTLDTGERINRVFAVP